mmetsp:Transcript_3771/g.13343  ORF Transcript_3771/g.13343 Transcript_3771/m.13343 type:complete len:102 (+) Transcript_3771:46-351(+)
MANLAQITREKRELMLKAGDVRQELKKAMANVEEQRDSFQERVGELEEFAARQSGELESYRMEVASVISATKKAQEQEDAKHTEFNRRLQDLRQHLAEPLK